MEPFATGGLAAREVLGVVGCLAALGLSSQGKTYKREGAQQYYASENSCDGLFVKHILCAKVKKKAENTKVFGFFLKRCPEP